MPERKIVAIQMLLMITKPATAIRRNISDCSGNRNTIAATPTTPDITVTASATAWKLVRMISFRCSNRRSAEKRVNESWNTPVRISEMAMM